MLIGVLGQGENPSDSEANDALQTLNEIVDKWNTEQLMIPFSSKINIPLIGKSMYTIGATGDSTDMRPLNGIISAFYEVNNVSEELKVLSIDEYNNITRKNYTGTEPRSVYYNGMFPNGELYVFPRSNAGKIVLNVSGRFALFDTLDDIISLPSGYIKALRNTLASDLCREYGKELTQDIVEAALGAKATIKATNAAQKKRLLRCDSYNETGNSFDIRGIY